jgi:hypothetical protein
MTFRSADILIGRANIIKHAENAFRHTPSVQKENLTAYKRRTMLVAPDPRWHLAGDDK